MSEQCVMIGGRSFHTIGPVVELTPPRAGSDSMTSSDGETSCKHKNTI